MNKYFITITAFQQLNKLDTVLQKTFLDEFQNKIINEDMLDVFEKTFEYIQDEYNNQGGRATMEFRNKQLYTGDPNQKCICKGARISLYISLTRIKGEVKGSIIDNQ